MRFIWGCATALCNHYAESKIQFHTLSPCRSSSSCVSLQTVPKQSCTSLPALSYSLKPAPTRDFCLLMFSARYHDSDVVPAGTTEHKGSFLKRSENNCHLNVKSSGWKCDGIRGKKGKHTDARKRYGERRKLMGVT